MPLNQDLIGKVYETTTYKVTADAIEKFARATNDDNDVYFRGEESVASPIFPIVPAFASVIGATMDPDLGANLLRLVHGTEEHVIYRAVTPGDVIEIAPVLESVEHKETGETFTVKATQTDQNGEVTAEVRGTMFIRGTATGKRDRTPAPAEEHEIVYEETTKTDEDQPRRYAEASGDHNPIHLDESTARMAGLPSVILHGMCTMAIAAKGAVNGLTGGDPSRIGRVAVRFTRPVIPGEELTTRFWRESEDGGVTTYGFETFNPKGNAVIKGGVVEVTG